MEWYNLVGVGLTAMFGPIMFAATIRSAETMNPWDLRSLLFTAGIVLCFLSV